jgi:hypothetical protein
VVAALELRPAMFDKKKSRPAGVRYQPIAFPLTWGVWISWLVRRMRDDGTRPAVAKM